MPETDIVHIASLGCVSPNNRRWWGWGEERHFLEGSLQPSFWLACGPRGLTSPMCPGAKEHSERDSICCIHSSWLYLWAEILVILMGRDITNISPLCIALGHSLVEESLYHASTLHRNTRSFSSLVPVISFSVSSTMELKEWSWGAMSCDGVFPPFSKGRVLLLP